MNVIWNAGLAAAGVALAALNGTPGQAADLNDGWRGGSLKDGPVAYAAPASRCYLRGDVGYAVNAAHDVRWTVTDPVTDDVVGDKVSNVSSGNSWLVEGGAGCGLGGNWRGEVMLGWRGTPKIDGEPLLWAPVIPVEDDPLHTKLSSATLMLNVYRDLGSFGNFTPYVGAGIGLARNKMHDVSFTDNLNLVNTIEGKTTTAFAWSLMAGTGYRLSERLTLDVGYRYMDLGKAESGNYDDSGAWNPRVRIDDIASHEIKVGLRIGFGGGGHHYQPMK